MSSRLDHIHLIAIGGTGMAALAGMLKASGYPISGSDHHVYSPMREVLEQQGIQYADGYRPENISKGTDLVIIGNAVSETNPEVQAVIELGIPYLSFPQALSKYFLTDRRPIVIAGTHGKTTTASMMAWVLDQAGQAPGFLIGGIVKNFSKNSRAGRGEYFVVEGDEYDTAFFDKGPKFLHYPPFASILTSIEYDHADIYPDLEKIKAAFSSFVQQVPAKGHLMAKGGDPNIREVLKQANCRVETYGLDGDSTWNADKLDFGSDGIRFMVRNQSEDLGSFFLPMSGRQNTLNALAVIGLSSRLGVPVEICRTALASFKGIKRRQEVLGTADGVTVIDDFAHHPTAIGETLSGLKNFYPGRPVWSIFEPRSATSRRRVFQDDLPRAFHQADQVIIAPLFAPEKIPVEERLDPQKVVKDIQSMGGNACFGESVDEIVKLVSEKSRPGDVICVMSSGGFGGLHSRLLDALNRRGSP